MSRFDKYALELRSANLACAVSDFYIVSDERSPVQGYNQALVAGERCYPFGLRQEVR